MKDKIFSTEEERKHAQKNYMAAIWKKVKNDFKVTSYHAVSMENREELFQHFKTLIDKTKQGKMNKGRGIKSYFLFEEYDGWHIASSSHDPSGRGIFVTPRR